MQKQEVEEVLSKTIHPEINFSLVKLGMIKDIMVKDSEVSLTLMVPFMGIPIKDMLVDMIKESIHKVDENAKVDVIIAEMSESERANFMALSREGWML